MQIAAADPKPNPVPLDSWTDVFSLITDVESHIWRTSSVPPRPGYRECD